MHFSEDRSFILAWRFSASLKHKPLILTLDNNERYFLSFTFSFLKIWIQQNFWNVLAARSEYIYSDFLKRPSFKCMVSAYCVYMKRSNIGCSVLSDFWCFGKSSWVIPCGEHPSSLRCQKWRDLVISDIIKKSKISDRKKSEIF